MPPLKLVVLMTFLLAGCAAGPSASNSEKPREVVKSSAQENTRAAILEVRTKKHPNGKLQSKGKVSLGESGEVAVGLWTYWYEDGQKSGEITYKQGNEHGPINAWHPNGKKKMSGFLKNGKPDATMTTWYDNGKQETVEHFKDGLADGVFESWYENGQLASRYVMGGGKAEGKEQGWYPDGKIMLEKSFKDDVGEGKVVAWYGDGKRRWEFALSRGRIDGQYTRWYRNGKKWFEGSYSDGHLEGAWKAWRDDGTRWLEATLVSGAVTTEMCWLKKGKERKCNKGEVLDLRSDYQSDSARPKQGLEELGEIYLVSLSKLKDQLCACGDDPCAQNVSSYMDKFAWEFQGYQPLPADDVHLKSIGREISACRKALDSKYQGLYNR